MPTIRIERTPVEAYYLGYLGFDHLQLMLEPTPLTGVPVPQDEWYIMEGVRLPAGDRVLLSVLGETGNLTLRAAAGGLSGEALEAYIGTPETRGSRVLVTVNAGEIWQQMAFHASDISDTQYSYWGYGLPASPVSTLNSTSFVTSVLYFSGVDISTNAPYRLRYSPGTETLLGGFDNDTLTITGNFTAIYGGFGQDILSGINDETRVDRLYGGGDNDTFIWSRGVDYLHGGDRSFTYAEDGVDTVDFSGAGEVEIVGFEHHIPHRTPQYIATHEGGITWMFSIERVLWASNSSDHITVGPGVDLIQVPLTMQFGGDSGDPRGDELDFAQGTDGLIINSASSTAVWVQAVGAQGDGGIWVDSVEWITASQGDDSVYAHEGMRGVDAGLGDDLVDARLVEAFGGNSPLGYDIEIYGGEGSDTIVSGAGRTYAVGGDGADTFVLSTLSSNQAQTVEFVIEGADASDTLLIPYNYFNGSNLGYEDSQLMQVLGGIGTFADMQEGLESFYEHRLWNTITFGNDQSQGVIQFIGFMSFELDDDDLLIHIYSGITETEVFGIDDAGNEITYTSVLGISATHTIIRVVDFDEGDLGLQFLDPGEPTTIEIGGEMYAYEPGWDSAVATLNAPMIDPLEQRPTAPDSDPNDAGGSAPTPRTPVYGTPAPDLIAYDEPAIIDAGGGDDTITGSGNSDDILDGGSGNDIMSGAGGDDTYIVDSAGDSVIENAGEGYDLILTGVDYVLPENVEDLTLAGAAIAGTGNDGANRIVGNEQDNALTGNAGNDTFLGDAGDDTLDGGDGSDGYVYFRGDGADTIVDGGSGDGDVDTLILFGGILPDDVSAYRLASSPDDLVLAFAGGGTVTITGFYLGSGTGIDRIYFEDGTVWVRSQIDALADTAPMLANTPPDASNDPMLVYGGHDYVVPAALLLANDRDADGDPLTVVAVSNVSSGSASVDANGDIQLVPPPGFEGVLTFTYTVSDGAGGTAEADVAINIVPNTAPIATSSIADQQATAGQAFSLTLPENLFIDPDFDLVSITVTLGDGTPLPEWLSYDWRTGTLSGTPPVGTEEAIVVRVSAFDGFLPTDLTFEIDITGSSASGPVAVGDALQTLVDTYLAIPNAVLLSNDTAGSGGLTIVSVGNASGGTVTSFFGSLVFAPDAGFVGTATLDYVVADSSGAQSSATVQIAVVAPDQSSSGTSGDDVLTGSAGNDIFPVLGNSNGFDIYDGGGGFDAIRGSPYSDTIGLANAPGNLAGIEAIDGGAGNDTIRLTSGDDALDLSQISVVGIELIDAGAGNDAVTGSAGADTIRGGAGDDVLHGGGGDDTFTVVSTEGFDVFSGGDGNDTILGSAYNDVIGLAATPGNLDGIEAIDGGAGSDTIRLTASDDILDLAAIAVTSIELIDAGAGADTVTGSAGNDTIRGGAGDDTLAGGEGNDVFLIVGGSEGFDTFDGGAGNDTVLGSAYNDIIGLAATAGNLSGIEAIDGGAGNDTLRLTAGSDSLDLSSIVVTSVELIDAGAGADTVTGSAGHDTIRGGAGDDTLVGGSGNDTFTVVGGSEGFDVFVGGEGTDTILGSAYNDVIGLAATGGNLSGIEAIDGGAGSDTIRLTGADDTLDLSEILVSNIELIDAGAGADTLRGSAGNDLLQGGTGADTFVFAGSFGLDIVTDFSLTGGDVIDVSAVGFVDFADLLAHSAQVGADTVITIDAANSITLRNVQLAQLGSDDVIMA